MRDDITNGLLSDYNKFLQDENQNDLKDGEKHEFLGFSSKEELVDKINSMDIGYSIIEVEEADKEDKVRLDMENVEDLGDISNDKYNDEDILFKREALLYCKDKDLVGGFDACVKKLTSINSEMCI